MVAQWVALALGAIGSLSMSRPGHLLAAAFGIGATYVLVASVQPGFYLMGGIRLDSTALSGSILTMAAVTLTGGVASPYLLLASMPSLLAALVGGFRIGVATSLLSAGLLAAMTVAQAGLSLLTSNLGAFALYPLLALLVAQIRALLVETEERAESLAVASAETQARLDQLVQAHELLSRLSEIYGSTTVNPVEVGRTALNAVVDSLPGSFATASLFDLEGPVVVARVGSDAPDLVRAQIPLGSGGRQLGVVSLATLSPLSEGERNDIAGLLRPVAVSFENALLLQDIAGTAVEEERLRLARELHDEVGPALASLGLALDVGSMQSTDPDMTDLLDTTRSNVTQLVEDLRRIIADLRAESAGTLSTEINRVLADLAPPPEVVVTLAENRPARPAMARQVSAIVIESIRNAHRHAAATTISVQGSVDRDNIDITVRDDGTGFDPTRTPDGHWGVAGMRERAARIGAKLVLDSNPDGTVIRLQWKDS